MLASLLLLHVLSRFGDRQGVHYAIQDAALQIHGIPSDEQAFVKLAQQKRTVMLCCRQWLGIYEMTVKIGKATSTAVLPIEENELLEKGGYTRIMSVLRYLRVTAVVVQGIPKGTLKLAQYLHRRTNINVAFVYHSGVGVHNVAADEVNMLGELAHAAKEREITLAFIEHDHADMFRHMGVPACAVPCTLSNPISTATRAPAATLRIGVLGTSMRPAVKNFYTQVSAACMVDGAEVHVTDVPDGMQPQSYLQLCAGKIVKHGKLSSPAFTQLLGQMDINLCVSWTDAVPNVIGNSLSARVPVVASDTTPWFDSAPALRSLLVESRVDDPSAIYRRIMRVLHYVREHPDDFTNDVSDMLYSAHVLAVNSWTCFIRDLACATHASLPSCPRPLVGTCSNLESWQLNATSRAP